MRKNNKVVLGLGAHPDDLELGCGGTLATFAAAGYRVVMGVVSIPSFLEQRKEEAQRGAEILGCEVRFLVPDKMTRVEDLKNYQLVGLLDELVDELNPSVILSHTEENSHVDHTLIYRAAIALHRLGGFDHFCYAPISCRPVNINFSPNTFVDITDKMDLKMQSIEAHYSQFDKKSLNAEHVQELARYSGGLIGVKYAEGFRVERQRILPGTKPR